MTLAFYPAAESEFLEAIDFYEESEEGLGLDLSREVFATIQRIIQHPNALSETDLRESLISLTKSCLVFVIKQ